MLGIQALKSLTLPLVLSALVAGCTSQQIEPPGISVHAGHSASGAAWRYRATNSPERIIVGSTRAPSLQSSLTHYQDIWRGLPGRGARIRIAEDDVSEVLVITLDRTALAKDNPLRGGINNWWYKGLYPRLLDTAQSAIESTPGEYRYSIHLASRTTERSLLNDRVAEAQYKLRHLAAWLIEDGIDPRMLTGQVIESEVAAPGAWELAVVIRPHHYGTETNAETFLPAWLY